MKKIKIILAITAGIFILTSTTTSAQVSVGISITAGVAPPPLVVYSQPPCPEEGYLWVPGYWAYGGDGYFWVPGVWVRPPQYGYLWTPAYWGYDGGRYRFHAGYWGPHVGFYGGINYGYGYSGTGFYGGRWEGNSFRYNTAVVNVNKTVIHNTYVDRTVIVNHTNNHTSFNGPGGISARPGPQEEAAVRERHVQATAEQTSHVQHAMRDRNQFASVNHGRPVTAAMNKPGGTPYNNSHAISSTHSADNSHAQQHQQPSVNHNTPQQHPQASANHSAPQQHPQASANHSAPHQHPQASANHSAPQQHPQAENNHPVPQQHQQAYNNHPQPSQQHAPQQQHHPAPQPQQPHGGQPHGESPHPKEH